MLAVLESPARWSRARQQAEDAWIEVFSPPPRPPLSWSCAASGAFWSRAERRRGMDDLANTVLRGNRLTAIGGDREPRRVRGHGPCGRLHRARCQGPRHVQITHSLAGCRVVERQAHGAQPEKDGASRQASLDTHRWQGFYDRRIRQRDGGLGHHNDGFEYAMPRRRLPARLYLRRGRDDRSSVWVILDGAKEVGTGASADDRAGAEKALQAYLAKNHRPPRGANRPAELLVAEVMSVYLAQHAPTRSSAKNIAILATPIITWWGDKSLADINGAACRDYVTWRTRQRAKNTSRLVGTQAARNELVVLRAAVRFYHKERGPLQAVPVLTLPAKKPPREGYFLDRSEIAKRIRAARRRPETRHIARLILVQLYTGSRPGAALRLRWLPSTEGGWIDVDNEIIHRRAQHVPLSKKRAPPVRIHSRLLPHLRRWRRADTAAGIVDVIHYRGRRVGRVYDAWESVRVAAGATQMDWPHVMRHSACTLLMASGADVAAIAGFVGMSIDTLVNVYGHHHPKFQEVIAQTTPKKQTNRGRTR